MPHPIVLKQHAEEASTQWWRRQLASRNSQTSIGRIVEFDDWIDAHLDGLREAGQLGSEVARTALEKALSVNAADVEADGFTVLALGALNDGFQGLITAIRDPHVAQSLDNWLSWAPSETAAQAISTWGNDLSSIHHHQALSYLYVHGLQGGDVLVQALQRSTTKSGSRVLDAIARCGRVDLLPMVLPLLSDSRFSGNFDISFAASRCALLLGAHRQAIAVLQDIAYSSTEHAEAACQLLSLALTGASLDEHIRTVLQTGNALLSLRCVGWSGSTAHVPWVIAQLREPVQVDTAAAVFRQMLGTGVDVVTQSGFSVPKEQGSVITLNGTMVDPDELANWWQERQPQIFHEHPYLWGCPATFEGLNNVLVAAEQEARELAALRHQLLRPGSSLFPARAHVQAQRQWLQRQAAATACSPPN